MNLLGFTPTHAILDEEALFSKAVARGEKDLESEVRANALREREGSDCYKCGRYCLHTSNTTYFEVTAFVRGPQRDSLVGRNYSGRVACRTCLVMQDSRPATGINSDGNAPEVPERWSPYPPSRTEGSSPAVIAIPGQQELFSSAQAA